MIEKILEAYEAKTADKNKFWNRLAKKDKFSKIVFWLILVSFIVVMVLNILFPSLMTIGGLMIVAAIMQIVPLFFERSRHKQWKTNLDEYQKDLDILAEILKDKKFRLYEKNKIKQLIRKYYQSIEREETRREKKGNSLKEFIFTYIVPIIAFFIGKTDLNDSSYMDRILIGAVIVVLVVSGRVVCYTVKDFMEILSWNQLEKEKYIVLKLQDLVDRDFTIELEDLLPIK